MSGRHLTLAAQVFSSAFKTLSIGNFSNYRLKAAMFYSFLMYLANSPAHLTTSGCGMRAVPKGTLIIDSPDTSVSLPFIKMSIYTIQFTVPR